MEEREMKFYPIGTVFKYKGKKLEVVEQSAYSGCGGCYGSNNPGLCEEFPCEESYREDGNDVIFVEVKEGKKKLKNSVKHTSDGCTMQSVLDADGNVSVQAVSGFNQGVDILLTLENSGNGYYVKHNSYNCTIPDHLFNLDYSEIEYLWLAYKAIRKDQKKKEKVKCKN